MNISNDINSTFSVRPINQKYVEWLAEEFKKDGYQKAYPVSVTHDGILWDGNHRYQACLLAGIKEIPGIIESPVNIRKAAHERNRAASSALPETFADHAEEIWGMLASGMTQQQAADELGWSREKVRNFSNLQEISPVVWDVIGTSFSEIVPMTKNQNVPSHGTNVPFTEGLLRNILDLTECHQLEIVNGLISGKIKNSQVKNLSKSLRNRESFAEYAIGNLDNKDDIAVFFHDCMSGLFLNPEQVRKAVISANEKHAKKNMIRVINGDCLSEMSTLEKFDMLLTDPPYSILKEDWDSFNSKEDFIGFSRKWISSATSLIKSTGRIYICWSQRFMFDFPFDCVSDDFVFGNVLIWNYRNNTKPNNQKIYKHTYEPIFYFYGKDAGPLNMPKSSEWDEKTNSYDVFTIAQPQTNFKDKKEHPAQKPEELFRQLMNIGSDIGDSVLDCFAGSGTTGVVSKKLKRKAVLIEKNEDFCKIIKRRLSDG